MIWLDSITDARNVNLGKLREMVRDGEAWLAASCGVLKSQTTLATEEQPSSPPVDFVLRMSFWI